MVGTLTVQDKQKMSCGNVGNSIKTKSKETVKKGATKVGNTSKPLLRRSAAHVGRKLAGEKDPAEQIECIKKCLECLTEKETELAREKIEKLLQNVVSDDILCYSNSINSLILCSSDVGKISKQIKTTPTPSNSHISRNGTSCHRESNDQRTLKEPHKECQNEDSPENFPRNTPDVQDKRLAEGQYRRQQDGIQTSAEFSSAETSSKLSLDRQRVRNRQIIYDTRFRCGSHVDTRTSSADRYRDTRSGTGGSSQNYPSNLQEQRDKSSEECQKRYSDVHDSIRDSQTNDSRTDGQRFLSEVQKSARSNLCESSELSPETKSRQLANKQNLVEQNTIHFNGASYRQTSRRSSLKNYSTIVREDPQHGIQQSVEKSLRSSPERSTRSSEEPQNLVRRPTIGKSKRASSGQQSGLYETLIPEEVSTTPKAQLPLDIFSDAPVEPQTHDSGPQGPLMDCSFFDSGIRSNRPYKEQSRNAPSGIGARPGLSSASYTKIVQGYLNKQISDHLENFPEALKGGPSSRILTNSDVRAEPGHVRFSPNKTNARIGGVLRTPKAAPSKKRFLKGKPVTHRPLVHCVEAHRFPSASHHPLKNQHQHSHTPTGIKKSSCRFKSSCCNVRGNYLTRVCCTCNGARRRSSTCCRENTCCSHNYPESWFGFKNHRENMSPTYSGDHHHHIPCHPSFTNLTEMSLCSACNDPEYFESGEHIHEIPSSMCNYHRIMCQQRKMSLANFSAHVHFLDDQDSSMSSITHKFREAISLPDIDMKREKVISGPTGNDPKDLSVRSNLSYQGLNISGLHMRPVEPHMLSLLYKRGREVYLKERKKLSPEEKFAFPVLSSHSYGWRINVAYYSRKKFTCKPLFTEHNVFGESKYRAGDSCAI